MPNPHSKLTEWCRWEAAARSDEAPRCTPLPGPPCETVGEAALGVIERDVPAVCGCEDPTHMVALVFPHREGWAAFACTRGELPALVERMRLFAAVVDAEH